MAVPQGVRPTALVTGGTTGIGLATARVLAKEYAVAVTGRDTATVAAARQELPGDVLVLAADARSLPDADRVADELSRRFGRLDLVFLNAGIGSLLPLEAIDEASYDEHFEVNVKGPIFLLQKVAPLLADGGSVVFNAALGAHRGLPDWSVYSATKGALLSFMRALAVELAPRGIRVNAVSPGPVETPALAKMGLVGEALTQWRQAMNTRVPLGRVGSGEDVANVVAFLASPAAAFITGTDIAVDGGMRAS